MPIQIRLIIKELCLTLGRWSTGLLTGFMFLVITFSVQALSSGNWVWRDGSGVERSAKDFKQILEQHKLWLESNGKFGKRANFEGADLGNLPYLTLDIRQACIDGSSLR